MRFQGGPSQQAQSTRTTAGKTKMKNETDTGLLQVPVLQKSELSSHLDGRNIGSSVADPSLLVTSPSNHDSLRTQPLHLLDNFGLGSTDINNGTIKQTTTLRLRAGYNKNPTAYPQNYPRSKLRAINKYLRLLHLYQYIIQLRNHTPRAVNENDTSSENTNAESSEHNNVQVEAQNDCTNGTQNVTSTISSDMKVKNLGPTTADVSESGNLETLNYCSEKQNLSLANPKPFKSKNKRRSFQINVFKEKISAECERSTFADPNSHDNAPSKENSKAIFTSQKIPKTFSIYIKNRHSQSSHNANSRKNHTSQSTGNDYSHITRKHTCRMFLHFAKKSNGNKPFRHSKIHPKMYYRNLHLLKSVLLNCVSIRNKASPTEEKHRSNCNLKNVFVSKNGIFKIQNFNSLQQEALVNKNAFLFKTPKNVLKIRIVRMRSRPSLFTKFSQGEQLKENSYGIRKNKFVEGDYLLCRLRKCRKRRNL